MGQAYLGLDAWESLLVSVAPLQRSLVEKESSDLVRAPEDCSIFRVRRRLTRPRQANLHTSENCVVGVVVSSAEITRRRALVGRSHGLFEDGGAVVVGLPASFDRVDCEVGFGFVVWDN